jgi:hypothetical protein
VLLLHQYVGGCVSAIFRIQLWPIPSISTSTRTKKEVQDFSNVPQKVEEAGKRFKKLARAEF